MDAFAAQALLKTPFLRDFSPAGLTTLTQYIDADGRTGALECLGNAGRVAMLYFIDGQLQNSEEQLAQALAAKQSTVAWMPEKRPRLHRPGAPSPSSQARAEIRHFFVNLEPPGEDWMAVFLDDELIAATGERISLTGLSALAGIVSEANGICPSLLAGQRASEFYLQQSGSRLGLKILDHGWIFFFRLSQKNNDQGRTALLRLQNIIRRYPGAGSNTHSILSAPGAPLDDHGEYIMLHPDRYRIMATRFRASLQTAGIQCQRWWFRPIGKPVGAEDHNDFNQETGTPIEHFARLVTHLTPFGAAAPEFFRLRSANKQVTTVFADNGDFWALQMEPQQVPERQIAALRQSAITIFADKITLPPEGSHHIRPADSKPRRTPGKAAKPEHASSPQTEIEIEDQFDVLLLHCNEKLEILFATNNLPGMRAIRLQGKSLDQLLPPGSMEIVTNWSKARGPRMYKDWSGEIALTTQNGTRPFAVRLTWWPEYAAKRFLLLVHNKAIP